jgi:hypothetical protein
MDTAAAERQYKAVCKYADTFWTGVYLVSRVDDTLFSVRLHGPTGPLHYVESYGSITRIYDHDGGING